MKRICIYIVIILIQISCDYKNENFVFPIITDSIPQTNSILNSNYMLEGGYGIIGVSEYGNGFEIINLDKKDDEYFSKVFMYQYSESEKKYENNDEIIEIAGTKFQNIPPPPRPVYNSRYIKYENKDLKIYIDTNQVLNMPDYKSNLDVNEKIKKGVNGYVEYSNSIKDSYRKYYTPSINLKQSYPLIVLNRSDSIIPIETKEGWLYMIQEAIDEKGEWKPIEYYDPFSFCGNSFWKKKLLPKHYLVSKIYKYTGDFKTKLRVKLTTNHDIYYSNEFNGSINTQQFSIPKTINEKEIDKKNIYFFNN